MLISHFIKAFMGRIIWSRLERKYHADNYILMPCKNEEYNYYALLYLDKFIQSKKSKKTVILTFDEGVIKTCGLFSQNKTIRVVRFSRIKAERIIKYYALYEFSTKLTIISLQEPYDTCGENLIGINGVTKEDLLCYDIYRFSEKPKVERPICNTKDEVIKRFLL